MLDSRTGHRCCILSMGMGMEALCIHFPALDLSSAFTSEAYRASIEKRALDTQRNFFGRDGL